MERKYTFVIGAGASREFDFPIGNELVSKISELLRIKVDDLERPSSGNRELLASLSRLSHPDPSKRLNQAYVYSTANWVSENMGLAASIDNFLDAHRERTLLPEIGKIAIACALLDSEKNSALWFDWQKEQKNSGFADFPPNWLTTLFRLLTTQRDFQAFRNALRSFRFVTFNYDRVIEKFFSDAINSYY
jgi:hypothetical protein